MFKKLLILYITCSFNLFSADVQINQDEIIKMFGKKIVNVELIICYNNDFSAYKCLLENNYEVTFVRNRECLEFFIYKWVIKGEVYSQLDNNLKKKCFDIAEKLYKNIKKNN